MKQNHSLREKFKKVMLTVMAVTLTLAQSVSADIAGSKIATGTTKLVSDATSWLLIIAPSVSVLLIIYYLIRKGMSDEMEHSAATRCCTI